MGKMPWSRLVGFVLVLGAAFGGSFSGSYFGNQPVTSPASVNNAIVGEQQPVVYSSQCYWPSEKDLNVDDEANKIPKLAIPIIPSPEELGITLEPKEKK